MNEDEFDYESESDEEEVNVEDPGVRANFRSSMFTQGDPDVRRFRFAARRRERFSQTE